MELSLPLPRRAPRRGTRRRTGSRRTVSESRTGLALAWLRGHPLALRATVGVLVAVPLLGGGWLWLRDSSLVAVRHVHITGVQGANALEIRQALDNAAVRMTTMDFNVGALRSAVSSFAIVEALHVRTSFPHSVSISVSERPPVAALLSAGQRTAVAADGTVLGPALLSSSLPTVNGTVEPPAGAHLHEVAVLAAVTVLGAAPPALAPFVVRVFEGSEGLTVAMRNGLLVYFGNSTRPHAKWLSLARVLTSPNAAGAAYVDVRLPERPAAGFSTTSPSTSTPVATGAGEPTALALAASLAKAAGGSVGSSTSSASGSSESKGSAGETERTSGSSSAPGSSESKATSGSSTEASGSGSGEASSSAAGGASSSAPGATGEAPSSSTGGASSAPVPGG
jgi:cell division protein FtsQ